MRGSCSDPPRGRRRLRQRGFAVIVSAMMLLLIILPAAGLAVDVGLLYLVQARLSAAADAASLAGARALNRGSDDSTQRLNAQTVAQTYFNANFPPDYFFSSNLQVTAVAATDSAFFRSVTTTASVDLPLMFMRLFRSQAATVRAVAKATRRDANIMVVVDRSGSLATSGSCEPLKAAAINFVEKFAEGRDNLGLVTFATSSRVDAPISSTFKSTVETTIGEIVCTGATNSAQALWQGYTELVSLNQTGALNAVLFFTDGRPTAVTETFPIKSSSSCSSKSAKVGVMAVGYNSSGTPTSAVGLFDPNATAQPMSSDGRLISSNSGCSFRTNTSNVESDVSYAPTTDYWGNSLVSTGYRSVTYNGTGLSITVPQNIENFTVNAADHAALRIRTGASSGGRSLSDVIIFTIGLGDVDDVLLRRMANDPAANNYNSTLPAGIYVYAPTAADLDQAFTRVASEILRLAI